MLTRKFRKEAGIHIPFRKPRDPTAATRYLYCTNCPEWLPAKEGGWQTHPLVEGLAEEGACAVQGVFVVAGKPLAFLTFADAEAAAAARTLLTADSFLPGRVMHVDFAEEAPPLAEVAARRAVPPVECTSVSANVEVPGMVLLEGLLSDEEAAAVVEGLDALPWESSMSRRVQHYGRVFNYETRKVDDDRVPPPFPGPVAMVAERAVAAGLLPEGTDQCTVNEYLPGQGIRAHVDTHSAFEEHLVSVSLLSSVVMELRPPAGATRHLDLPPSSALLFTGASRFQWTHGIPTRRHDRVDGEMRERSRRVSLTFRKVRRSRVCTCAFPAQCDSQEAVIPVAHSVGRSGTPGGGRSG
ncbi:hypothetical protein T484DRAFT_1907362, partial [Baffinella frigidus]